MNKKYPIGIQSFEEIRSDNYYYVDKSRFVHALAESGKYYFLSRPRRFGKSLFLDTLNQAFSGKKEYFKGLFLENNWNWDKTFPVIHLSFGAGVIQDKEHLKRKISFLLNENRKKYSVSFEYTDIEDNLFELITKASEKAGEKAVLLIDEYDKPILDNIDNPQTALTIKDTLKDIYSVIKELDRHLKFVFITGVSKFSRVSIFSGLNNLKDITLDHRYSAICGYTESELADVFSQPMKQHDTQKVRQWYNGYNFLGEPVYNPYDILLFLDSGEFKNYWFESGTPSFLINLLKKQRFFLPSLEHLEAGEGILGNFDLESLEPETLLFQTGYLTIKEKKTIGIRTQYILTYPNMEIKTSLLETLLIHYSCPSAEKERRLTNLSDALFNSQPDRLKEIFHSFFSSIPHDWYRNNRLAEYEGYYASVFYTYFAASGFSVIAEDTTNKGRIDLTVKVNNTIYILEFKVVETDAESGTAMKQIKQKGYADKYMNQGCVIFLIGIEFSKREKNISYFEWEQV